MTSEPDEQTYHRAAQALVTAQGDNLQARTARTLAAGWVRRDDFRAAVKAAYEAGRARGSDIEEAAIAYTTEPEGSDQIEHYWHQLKEAVEMRLKVSADG